MATSHFYVEAYGVAARALHPFLRVHGKGLLVQDVTPGAKRYEVEVKKHESFVGGLRLRHGDLLPHTRCVAQRKNRGDIYPLNSKRNLLLMVDSATKWLQYSGTDGLKREHIHKSTQKLFHVVGVSASDGGTWKMLRGLLQCGVPVCTHATPPCVFEVVLEDGRTVDVFKVAQVVCAWQGRT